MSRRFDTIRDARLRGVLESDYAELQIARANGMSKASLVLAGGIVEAVLINYLEVVGYQHPPKAIDPRSMQLGDLIGACEAEGTLTAETAALSRVLQSYRNLVHPGRSVRTDELPDEARAEVAEQLVERVIGDVAARARRRPEWAAEAVLEMAMDKALVEFDVAVRREVRRLPPSEAGRLVVQVLPDRFAVELAGRPDEADWNLFKDASECCFRRGLSVVPMAVRTKAAERLLSELERASLHAGDWLEVFFISDLMEALEDRRREYLFSYVLQALPEMLLQSGIMPNLDGVGPYLSAPDAGDLVFILAEQAADDDEEEIREWAHRTLLGEMPQLPPEARDAARRAMDEAVERHTSQPEAAAQLGDLRYCIWPLEDREIPR